MHPYPHVYKVSVAGPTGGEVALTSPGLPELTSQAPPEFEGPAGYWSPETLLVAAVAGCFLLSFRAVARASKLEWVHLSAEVEGVLERVEHVTRFTRFTTRARLVVPAGTDAARARSLAERAEKICLVSNSLTSERHIEIELVEG